MSARGAPGASEAALGRIAPWAVLLACQVPLAVAAAALLLAVVEGRL